MDKQQAKEVEAFRNVQAVLTFDYLPNRQLEKSITFYHKRGTGYRAYELTYNVATGNSTFCHWDVPTETALTEEAHINVNEIRPIQGDELIYMNKTLLPVIREQWNIVLHDGTGDDWTTRSKLSPHALTSAFLDRAV